MKENKQKALEVAAELCRHFEGFSSVPYICPAGYATQGYGTVYKPDGSRVTMNDSPISKSTAEMWLLHELEHTYMLGVLKASPLLINHPKSLGAITDFAYNLGVARYRSSTLKTKINALDWKSADTEIKKWVRGGGKILPGLVRRRAAESLLLGK